MKIQRGIRMATGTCHSCLCHRTIKYRSSGHRHPRHAHRQMWLPCLALETLGSQPSVQSGGHGQLPLLCLLRRDLVSLMLPKPPHPPPLREGESFLICFPQSCIWLHPTSHLQRTQWHPLQSSCLENPMGRGTW